MALASISFFPSFPLAARVAVRRIALDFTGDGVADTLVLYQNRKTHLGHFTIFGKQNGSHRQLYISPTLPIVDLTAEDVDGDSVSEVLLFTSRSDGRDDFKILGYAGGTWKTQFRRIVESPDDVSVQPGSPPILLVGGGGTPLKRFRIQDGKYEELPESPWVYRSFAQKDLGSVQDVKGSSKTSELLLLGEEKKGGRRAFLFHTGSLALLIVEPERAGKIEEAAWTDPSHFALTFCPKGGSSPSCKTDWIEYPGGAVAASAEGSLVSAVGERLFLRSPKGDLFSYFLFDPTSGQRTYLFDGSWAASYSKSLFVYSREEGNTSLPAYYLYDLFEGKQKRLSLFFIPDQIVPFAHAQGFLVVRQNSLFFFPLGEGLGVGKEELWYQGLPGEALKVSAVTASEHLALTVRGEKSVKTLLFDWKKKAPLWALPGAWIWARKDGELFGTDGRGLYRESGEKFVPVAGEGSAPISKERGVWAFIVQIAAGPEYRRVEAVRDRLRQDLQLQEFPLTVAPKIVEGNLWYALRFGPFSKKEDAQALQRLLEKKGYQTWLTRALFY